MSGDTLDFLQGTKETLTGTLHDPAATTGHVLTVQADKSIAAAPGGSASPVQGVYSSVNAVSINNGATGFLTFDQKDSGSALLDITTPNTPTFVAAGTYAVSVVASGEPLTAAGFAVVTLSADGGTNGAAYTASPPDSWGASGVCIVAAGDTLQVQVSNNDGAATRAYSISSAVIVKLA